MALPAGQSEPCFVSITAKMKRATRCHDRLGPGRSTGERHIPLRADIHKDSECARKGSQGSAFPSISGVRHACFQHRRTHRDKTGSKAIGAEGCREP